MGPEFERVAAAGDAGEGVAGQGVVAALLVSVELEASGLCERVGSVDLLITSFIQTCINLHIFTLLIEINIQSLAETLQPRAILT